jgi:hypothetical protein
MWRPTLSLPPCVGLGPAVQLALVVIWVVSTCSYGTPHPGFYLLTIFTTLSPFIVVVEVGVVLPCFRCQAGARVAVVVEADVSITVVVIGEVVAPASWCALQHHAAMYQLILSFPGSPFDPPSHPIANPTFEDKKYQYPTSLRRGEGLYFLVPHRFHPESGNSARIHWNPPEWHRNLQEWHRNSTGIGISSTAVFGEHTLCDRTAWYV